VSPDGETIYEQDGDLIDKKVWRWHRDDEGVYIREDDPVSDENFIDPGGFSPSGEYIVANDIIWDADTLTPVTIPETLFLCCLHSPSNKILWLPDESYFVTFGRTSILDLYRLGQNEPIDSLLVRDVGIEVGEMDEISDAEMFSSQGMRGVTDDGRILINLGKAGLVVPIIYQEMD
jgi:hypothetical protein